MLRRDRAHIGDPIRFESLEHLLARTPWGPWVEFHPGQNEYDLVAKFGSLKADVSNDVKQVACIDGRVSAACSITTGGSRDHWLG
jgi:hypothetical protein